MSERLEKAELISLSKRKIPSWEVAADHIFREVDFDDYMEGIDFANDVAEIAEKRNHHPEMTIGWCHVKITLSTHRVKGVTTDDIEVAEEIDLLIG